MVQNIQVMLTDNGISFLYSVTFLLDMIIWITDTMLMMQCNIQGSSEFSLCDDPAMTRILRLDFIKTICSF